MTNANDRYSGEVRAQGTEHLADDVVMDGRKRGGDGHTPEYPWDSLAEAYARGRCDFHVHFRARTVEGRIAGEWCAAFNRTPKELDVVGGQVVGDKKARASLPEKNDMGQLVLVFDIKPVELPKAVAAEPVPSLVRLQPLNDCLRAWVNPPEPFVEFCRSIGALGGEDGEPGLVSDGLGQPSTHVGDSKFKGEVVEGSPEIMDTVADDEAKVSGRWVEHFEPHELVEVINIEIRPSSVRAFFSPGSHFGFKALQVIERPVESSFVMEGHGC